jgi:methyl-accepting chemotaxis protein
MKIRNKMMMGYGVLMSGILISLMLILSFIVQSDIEKSIEFQLQSTTDSVTRQVQGFFDASVKAYVRGIAEQNLNILESHSGNEEAIAFSLDLFNRQKIGHSGYTYVLDTRGTIISHPDQTKIGSKSTFTDSLQKMDSFQDEYLIYDYEGRKKVLYRTYYAPLNYLISVTANEDELLDLIDMASLSEQINSIKVGDRGYVSIFTTDYKVIVHPQFQIGASLSSAKDVDGNLIVRDMVERTEGSLYYNWKESDDSIKQKFAFFKTIDSLKWVINVSGYKDDYFALLTTLNSVLLILSLISICVILVIVFIMSNIIVKPITGTSNLLQDISRGNGDLTQKLAVKSKDEVGKMAEYFNIFTENLSQLINNVKLASDSSVRVKEDLSANFEETVSSLSQIDSNLQNVNIQMSNMNGKVTNSTNAMHEVINGINALDSQIQEQAGAVEESTASVTEMVASLKSVSQIVARKREAAKELVQTSRVGGEHINLTKTTFEKGISTKISEISEMTTIIDNIASQTNLLSMNAAIEAAHAGDAGKGFAVVANEIRKLAEDSTKNSKKITEVIKTIVQYIGKTDDQMKDTAEIFVNIEHEVKDMDTALAEILNASQELSTGGEEVLSAMIILADISTNVTQKSSIIKENSSIVSDSIEEVTTIAQDVSNAVSEVASGAAEINKTMVTSQDLIVDLGEATIKVNSEVGRFKTN